MLEDWLRMLLKMLMELFYALSKLNGDWTLDIVGDGEDTDF